MYLWHWIWSWFPSLLPSLHHFFNIFSPKKLLIFNVIHVWHFPLRNFRRNLLPEFFKKCHKCMTFFSTQLLQTFCTDQKNKIFYTLFYAFLLLGFFLNRFCKIRIDDHDDANVENRTAPSVKQTVIANDHTSTWRILEVFRRFVFLRFGGPWIITGPATVMFFLSRAASRCATVPCFAICW